MVRLCQVTPVLSYFQIKKNNFLAFSSNKVNFILGFYYSPLIFYTHLKMWEDFLCCLLYCRKPNTVRSLNQCRIQYNDQNMHLRDPKVLASQAEQYCKINVCRHIMGGYLAFSSKIKIEHQASFPTTNCRQWFGQIIPNVFTRDCGFTHIVADYIASPQNRGRHQAYLQAQTQLMLMFSVKTVV